MRFPIATTVLLLAFTHGAKAGDATANLRTVVRDGWTICETPRFAVWSRGSAAETRDTSRICEELHGALSDVWLREDERRAWSSRAVVVVHRDATGYQQAMGLPGDRSVGCTTLQVGDAGVTFRRIDLRADAAAWQTSALAHEMTHLILADRFGQRSLPLWADEGLAMLSEPDATRLRRQETLANALRAGGALPLRDLLGRHDPPAARVRDVFYSESAAVTALLVDRATPATFLTFLDAAGTQGYDVALQNVYAIDGVSGLERLWDENSKAAALGALDEATGRAALAVRVRANARTVSVRSAAP